MVSIGVAEQHPPPSCPRGIMYFCKEMADQRWSAGKAARPALGHPSIRGTCGYRAAGSRSSAPMIGASHRDTDHGFEGTGSRVIEASPLRHRSDQSGDAPLYGDANEPGLHCPGRARPLYLNTTGHDAGRRSSVPARSSHHEEKGQVRESRGWSIIEHSGSRRRGCRSA